MVFVPFLSENGHRLCPFWSGIEHICRFNCNWIRKKEKFCEFEMAFSISNLSNDDVISAYARSENGFGIWHFFWSEIGSSVFILTDTICTRQSHCIRMLKARQSKKFTSTWRASLKKVFFQSSLVYRWAVMSSPPNTCFWNVWNKDLISLSVHEAILL